MDKRRAKPYVWATWLAAYLSGDRSCAWAAWYKAHHQFEKLADPRANDLSRWRADHAAAVGRRAVSLEEAGWAATVEDQNKLTVRGRAADLAGQPDLIAVRGFQARIDDVKTGKRRESDYWQVVIYMVMHLLAPLDRLIGKELRGFVVYNDGEREVLQGEAEAARDRVLKAIRDLASPTAPRTVPSAAECARCDIAACKDRVSSQQVETTTEAF